VAVQRLPAHLRLLAAVEIGRGAAQTRPAVLPAVAAGAIGGGRAAHTVPSAMRE
jgi:hypothetical protein